MTENSDKNQPMPWQFKPGQSGNARGKPKGARNHATRVVEQLLDNDAKLLVGKARNMALAVTPSLSGYAWSGSARRARAGPSTSTCPQFIQTLSDASAAVSKVIASTAAGQVTPDEAASIVGLIDAKRRILLDVDLEERITALEGRAAGDS
jgi:hypothetical protein